jgi:hypothetical protein
LDELLDESIRLKEMLDLEVAKLLLKMDSSEAGWRKDAMAIEIESSSERLILIPLVGSCRQRWILATIRGNVN